MLIIHVLPHVIDPFLRPGLDHNVTRFIQELKHLAPEDHHELWTMSKGIPTERQLLHPDGFLIRFFPSIRFLPMPLELSFPLLMAVFKKAWKEKTVLWHIHGYYFWMVDFLAILLFFMRRKFLAHHRGGGVSFTRKAFLYTLYHYFLALPLTLRMATKILVQNHREEKRIQKWYRISKKKLLYFPNVIGRVSANTEYRSGHQLLYVGRLEKIKGLLPLLDALEQSFRSDQSLVLIVIGTGSLEHALKQKIADRHLEQHVRMIPWQTKDEVSLWYQKSDVFLYPNEKSEGCPLSLIEAQGYGLPAIGFRIEGVEDVIEDGKTGFVVKSWQAFQEKLTLLLTDHPLRKTFSKAAKKRAREEFSAEQFYPLLIKIYHRL